jgi:hypothetical protein
MTVYKTRLLDIHICVYMPRGGRGGVQRFEGAGCEVGGQGTVRVKGIGAQG